MSGLSGGVNFAAAAVVGAVLNTLWLSVAATGLLWLALRYTRLGAEARHRVWWAWFGVLLLLPLGPSLLRERQNRRPAPVPRHVAAEYRAPVRVAPVDMEPPAAVKLSVDRGPAVAFALWMLWMLAQTSRLGASFLHLRRWKRAARPADSDLAARFARWLDACQIERPVRLLVSDRLTSPMAVGFLHPAVLLPEALIEHLSEADLDHVILHELAHLARRDDWTNLLARLAVAAFGWHPAAAWVLGRIGREREMACDEWVVAATGAARPYAASLARLFEICSTQQSEALATGMAGRGSHLGDRIELLVRRTGEAAPRGSMARVTALAAVLLVLLVAGSRAPRWVAFAQNRPAARTMYSRPVAFTQNVPSQRQMNGRQIARPNSRSFLATLVAAGYGDLSVDDIIALKNHGVSADFIRGVSESGWGKLTAQQLMELTSRGVPASYLRDMHESGVRDLNVQGVIRMHDRSVQPSYPRQIHELGLGPFTAEQIAEFSAHGVRIELLRGLKAAGFTHLTPNEIYEAQNTGLGEGNLREAKQYGGNLSLNQILRLKRAGVI